MGEGMNVEKMKTAATAVIGVAVIVLIAIAIINGMGKTMRTEANKSISDLTMLAVNATTPFGTSYSFVQNVSGCGNKSGGYALNQTWYTVIEGDDTGTGGIKLNDDGSSFVGVVINCTKINYLAASSGSDAAVLFRSGLTVFGTFMAIIVLALVGKSVISFYKKKD